MRDAARRALRVLLAAASALAILGTLAGCCASPDPGEGLEGIDWVLQGTSTSAVDFRVLGVTARFSDGILEGFSGVNDYSAKYRIDRSGALSLSAITSTERAGTPEAMRAEELYLTLLGAVRSFALEDGSLDLLDADGQTLLVFEKAAPKATEEPAEKAPSTGKPAKGSTEATAASAGPSGVSEASLAYARSLGGTSHRGELLYIVVGSEHTSEQDAREALEEALPLFGDMQSYFIVQDSDNLAGLTPDRWVIVEAFRNTPSETNLQFARRAFPEARVQRATVSTGDPIPVYEDLVD